MANDKVSRVWETRPYDPDSVARLSQQTKIPPMVAQVLYGRGVDTPEKIVSFLAPPSLSRGLHKPSKLPGCVEAAKFLAEAIRAGKKIVVYGDYDVDGMTATAVLLQGIRVCGGECMYYVPNRLGEGYGLNCEALERFKTEDGASVVVTVDCGITSVKEAEFAKSIGLDLVITDHHTPLVDEETQRQRTPDAAAIVHPKLVLDDFPPYPFPEICGAFVAFKLAWQLGVEMGPDGVKTAPEVREFLLGAIGLAALGTIADVVPLQDENRTLVRYALDHSLVERMPLGVKFLLESASATQRAGHAQKKLTSDDVGFTIAPRLNAAGREVLNAEMFPSGSLNQHQILNQNLDQEDLAHWLQGQQLLAHPHQLAAAGQMGLASLGVELLITEQQARARELAPYINHLNQTRQKLERNIMREAEEMIKSQYADAPAFVLASRQWHQGVIGIVAGRLADKYYRPTVMIALRNPDSNPGSARGVPDSSFNMYNALDHCSEYLERFGGHAAAAGLGVKESNVDAFRDAFCDYVENHFAKADSQPRLFVDSEIPFSAITVPNFHELEKLAPFGAENQHPVFASFGVTLESVRGAGQNQSVLQAKFRQFQTSRRAVSFNRADWIKELEQLFHENPGATYDIAYTLAFNDFVQQVELRLLDWRVSGSAPAY